MTFEVYLSRSHTGHWTWTLDLGLAVMPVVGRWTFDIGLLQLFRTLDIGHWTLDFSSYPENAFVKFDVARDHNVGAIVRYC